MLDDKQVKLVPTLDGVGYIVRGGRDKLDRLLSNFFTSDGMQSTIWENLKTYQVIASANIENVERLREEINLYLDEYLHDYFDNIDVTVSITDLDGVIKNPELITTNGVGLRLSIQYVDEDETTYTTLEKPVIYKNGVFEYVMDKFNGN